MKLIYREEFSSLLGPFEINILSTDSNAKAAATNLNATDIFQFESRSYEIKILKQSLERTLGHSATVANRVAWCIFFKKSRPEYEKLRIRFELNSDDPQISPGSNSGEDLDAMWYDDSKFQVHVGTEDGEVQMERAKVEDWLPARYAKYLNWTLEQKKIHIGSFTEYTKTGFLTRVPNLKLGEEAYFHFILAEKAYKEHDNDTWLAVDVSKEQLLAGYPNI